MPRTTKARKRRRPIVVALVDTRGEGKEETRMVIEVTLKVGKEERRVQALVDSGAEANCIQRKLAVEMNIPESPGGTTRLISPSGGAIYSYADHTVRVAATDTQGDRRVADVPMVSCDFDLGEVGLILGFPWLTIVDPVISFATTTWRHQVNTIGLELQPAKKFAKTIRSEPYVYALYITPTTVSRRVAAVGTKGVLPPEFQDFAHTFSATEAGVLPEHHTMEHRIDLEPGTKPPYGPIYALSEKELEVLREYLVTSVTKGWIRRSTSSAGAPIMFVPKKGGGLRLCVDYRGLNRITIKDRTPLPLIGETMDRLGRAKRFTKLDLKDAYHRLRIREGDEWKTAF